MERSCLEVLREVLFVLDQLEREMDPDKRASIRAALRVLIERHIEAVGQGRAT